MNSEAASIGWEYPRIGILRLVIEDQEPHVTTIDEGRWIIGLGVVAEIMPDSPEALEILGPIESVSLHVNGGDGPLLISRSGAVAEFYANQYDAEMRVYLAVPMK